MTRTFLLSPQDVAKTDGIAAGLMELRVRLESAMRTANEQQYARRWLEMRAALNLATSLLDVIEQEAKAITARLEKIEAANDGKPSEELQRVSFDL